MGLKKLGQDVAITINGNTSSYLRNIKKNPDQANVDTTGLADAALGYKTSQPGCKSLEITGEIMHPADGEPSDDVYDDLTAAFASGDAVDVVFDGVEYADMAVFEGETSVGPDEVVATQFTLRLTAAPAGS